MPNSDALRDIRALVDGHIEQDEIASGGFYHGLHLSEYPALWRLFDSPGDIVELRVRLRGDGVRRAAMSTFSTSLRVVCPRENWEAFEARLVPTILLYVAHPSDENPYPVPVTRLAGENRFDNAMSIDAATPGAAALMGYLGGFLLRFRELQRVTARNVSGAGGGNPLAD